jgi:hypothetical protein
MGGLPRTLAGLRDATLISVGYGSFELAAMNVEHLCMPAGRRERLIAHPNGDQVGDGSMAVADLG